MDDLQRMPTHLALVEEASDVGYAEVPEHVEDESGITTAEYAVGTAAGAGLAGLLYKLLTGGFGDKMLKTLFDHVLGLLGVG